MKRTLVVAVLALAFPASAVAGWTWDDRAVNDQIYAGDGGGPVHRGDACSWHDYGQIAVTTDGELWCVFTGRGETGLTWE
jgi:hypothetical protein